MGILLTDLADIVMIRSGQFIVGAFENVQLDYDKFWKLCRGVIYEYQNHKPITKKFNVNVPQSGYRFASPDPAPLWISKVIPINGYGAGMGSGGFGGNGDFAIITPHQAINLARSASMGGSSVVSSMFPQPSPFFFELRDDILYVSSSGMMDVTAHYPYTWAETVDDEGKVTEVLLEGLDPSHDQFIELVLADFLVAVGRSRRAFTLNDLPITMDAPDLVSEGLDRREKVKEALSDRGIWYRAIGI